MFTAGIELFFGLAAGAVILCLAILLLTAIFYACRAAWDRLTVFPGVLVVYAVAALIGIGLLLRYS